MDHAATATRRRRALFRAMHRGTKEMDWFLGKYAEAHLDDMEGKALDLFERLLLLPDPDLNQWILTPDLIEDAVFIPLIQSVRAFHGLEDETSGSDA